MNEGCTVVHRMPPDTTIMCIASNDGNVIVSTTDGPYLITDGLGGELVITKIVGDAEKTLKNMLGFDD